MEASLKYGKFEHTHANLSFTIDQIKQVIELDEYKADSTAREAEILDIYHDLHSKTDPEELSLELVQQICLHLDRLYTLFLEHQPEVALQLIELRLAWDSLSPHAWYELGKIYYQDFISRETEDLDPIIHIFQHVIELVERFDKYHDMGFWAYSYMANLYLYRLLSGEEALVQAMKNYNMAYRFSQTYEISAHDEFIFDDLEILQNILMNQYPLLVLIYNDSGVSLYEYLFQFVEVITQEQRFIPNFTALMSVVDERMYELFNSTISSAYLVLENRLMVMTTLWDRDKKEWIKIALIFSYLQQSEEDVVIDQEILNKVKQLKQKILANDDITAHLQEFKGKHDWKINEQIEMILHEVFTVETDE